MRFCIIYILLVPLCVLLPNFSSLCFYYTVGEALCESNPALRWCLSLCEHHLAGSCSYALAQGEVESARPALPDSPLEWEGGHAGRRRVIPSVICDLSGMEPQRQSPSPSSPGANLFGVWDHCCLSWMNACTHYKSYRLSTDISLTPTKNIYNMSW